MKIAIFALTRGYPQEKSSYRSLIKRNTSIYEHINKFRDDPADIILFHEGNISSNDQRYINSFYPENLIFKDVSQYFNVKDLNLEGEEKFNLGYRIMCRFNMYHVWKELENYDYVLRVDEDIEINDFDPFIFEKMEKENQIYLTGRFTKDTHILTNKTLPQFLIENTDLDVEKVYNHRNPYTNLYASSVKFWNDDDIKFLLEKISLSDQQIINRWGDHTVQGILLNHKKTKINLFPKLTYRHISHDLVIKNNYFRNITINSKFNPISTKGGFIEKIKLRIKGKMVRDIDIYDFRNN